MISSRQRSVVYAGLVACVLVYSIAGITQEVGPYDEAVIAVGAVRVMAGEVPYRDFWAVYSPGSFYVLAAMFKLFGVSILVERLTDVAMRLLLIGSASLLAANLVSRRFAFVTMAAVAPWVGYYGSYSYPVFPALAFCYASIWMTGAHCEGRGRAWLFGAGVSAGIAALYRHDIGIYCVFSQSVALGWFTTMSARAGHQRARLGEWTRSFLKTETAFACGVGAVVLPVAAYLITRVPMADLAYDFVAFPASYTRFRGLPYPPANAIYAIPFYSPFVILLVAALRAIAIARTRPTAGPLAQVVTAGNLIVFGMVAFNQTRIRADMIHSAAFLLTAIVLLIWLLGNPPLSWSQAKKAARPSVAAGIGWMLYGLIVMEPLLIRVLFVPDSLRIMPGADHGLERAASIVVPSDMAEAARYLRNHTVNGERVYVGTAGHDRIWINVPMLYFLADRPSASRFHDLHPGVATTVAVQKEIADDLDRYQVRYIVLSSTDPRHWEPNGGSLSSGVHILDDYIDTHYRVQARFGSYTVWGRL